MEIIQEIGSYAGFAAVVGLAVLSALYFSQARDVKRLREWAGRAPERSATPAPPAAQPQRVVAQPIQRPGGPGPVVPRPPGAPGQPGTPVAKPAAASAAGAAPAVAGGGPAPATPAAAQAAGTPSADEEQDANGAVSDETEIHQAPPAQTADDEESPDTGEGEAVGQEEEPVEDEEPRDGDTSEETVAAPALEQDPEDTGEWRPEDEHADYDFTDEHDAVPAAKPLPPRPPQPFPRRGGATPAGRTGRGPILPPYEQARPTAEPEGSPSRGRRPILLAIAAVVGLAVIAFGVLQLTGGGSGGGDGGGVSATQSDGGSGGDANAPVDPSSVTVAVLNGTTQPGLAAQIGDQIANEGFVRGVVTNNSDQTRAESVVLYAPGAEREAVDVSRRLDIPQREPIDSASQSLAGDATVVVIAGADKIQ